MTLPEIVLWQALRRSLLGLRFRRQHPIGPYVLDFYCPSARLAIEIDGLAHDSTAQAQHDERRQTWLVQQGVRVVRFRATDVLRDEALEGVLQAIGQAVAPPAPPDQVRGRHLPRFAGEEPAC